MVAAASRKWQARGPPARVGSRPDARRPDLDRPLHRHAPGLPRLGRRGARPPRARLEPRGLLAGLGARPGRPARGARSATSRSAWRRSRVLPDGRDRVVPATTRATRPGGGWRSPSRAGRRASCSPPARPDGRWAWRWRGPGGRRSGSRWTATTRCTSSSPTAAPRLVHAGGHRRRGRRRLGPLGRRHLPRRAVPRPAPHRPRRRPAARPAPARPGRRRPARSPRSTTGHDASRPGRGRTTARPTRSRTSSGTGRAPSVWRGGRAPRPRRSTCPGDVFPVAWYPDGRHLLVRHEFEARAQLHRLDTETGATELVADPLGDIAGAGLRPDGAIWLHAGDGTAPPATVDADGRAGRPGPDDPAPPGGRRPRRLGHEPARRPDPRRCS